MGDDLRKKSYFIQNLVICAGFCAPLVAAGYAAHAVGKWWLIIAGVECLALALFFSYCPDDNGGES